MEDQRRDFAHYESPIAQLPHLKAYTHMLLCFPLGGTEAARAAAMAGLDDAVKKVQRTFPWLGAQVVHRDRSTTCSGTFGLAPCVSFSPPGGILRVRDVAARMPTYGVIRERRAPVALLPASVLTSRTAFPQSYVESDEDPAPVALFEACLVDGGLLLDVCAQHNFMDAGGMFQLLRLVAAAMRGEEFDAFAVEQGNRDRRHIVPLLRLDEEVVDYSHLRRPSWLNASAGPAARPHAPWCFFRFSKDNLERLKTIVRSGTDEQVSINDAISALCWQRISVVRLAHGHKAHGLSKFCRAIDGRRAVGLRPEYMGHMVHMATARLSLGDLESSSLGLIAKTLRQSVQDVNHAQAVRSFVTLVAREPDKTTIGFGGVFDPSTDVGSSSLCHSHIFQTSFGTLGMPEFVRRPNFGPLESDLYLWTRTRTGDIDVLACFQECEMEALKTDELWCRFAETIG